MSLLNIALWLSALGLGFLSACIALYGRYRILPSFLTGPNICRLEEGGCQALFRTPTAALLGIPNSLLGTFYYPLLAAGLLFQWPLILLLAASTSAFLMTIYLGWWLIHKDLECRVCWTGHLCNTVIWIVLLIQYLK